MKNGFTQPNGWIKYLVGILVSLIVFIALPMICNNVVANDRDSRARDTKLRETMITRDENILEKIEKETDKIEDKIDYLKAEQKIMRQEATNKFTEILVAIEGLKK